GWNAVKSATAHAVTNPNSSESRRCGLDQNLSSTARGRTGDRSAVMAANETRDGHLFEQVVIVLVMPAGPRRGFVVPGVRESRRSEIAGVEHRREAVAGTGSAQGLE